MLKKIFVKLSFLLPENIIGHFKELMVQGGFSISARAYAGYSLLISFIVSILILQFSSLLVSQLLSIGIALFTFILLMVLFYLMILTAAENRARQIEMVLPDALQMISANIRAGMTIENAIWSAAKPEFGPLEEEIRIVSGKVFGGKPISDALGEMAKRVRSSKLRRAVKLIVEGIQLGGSMAPLLDEVASDLKKSILLSKEISTATTMYMIFIIFTSVIASPIMFAASVYYAEMSHFITQQRAGVGELGSVGGLPGAGLTTFVTTKPTAETVTPSDVMQFAVATIILTTFFGALILAQIRYGRVTRGLKFIPIFMIAALLIFFVTNSILKGMFGFLFQ